MLQKTILQLTEKDYSLLSSQIQESKADKYLALLTAYRKEKITNGELIKKLNVKSAAYYTLKSRLNEIVQLFLLKNVSESRIELIQTIAKIEYLLYNAPRATAIQILKKLEAELINKDMPYELTSIYKALKRLHLYSPKYRDYSQLYNKCTANNQAQDKAEDLLSLFCKALSEYYLSRSEQELTRLVLLKKEMKNVCRHYESHRLTVYKNILNVHFDLFTAGAVKTDEVKTIEEMLQESLEIIETHSEDKVYTHLISVIHFLYFEYYLQHGLYKNAGIYYDKIIEKTETMYLFGHSCFASHFLISTIKYKAHKSNFSNFYSEDDSLEEEIDPENLPGFILINYRIAVVAFYEGRYPDAILRLNKLLRETTFKKEISFSEAETKLFLALNYFLNGEKAPALNILKNASRKINKEKEIEKYLSALKFIKLLKSCCTDQVIKTDKKIAELHRNFNAVNEGRYKILEFLTLNEDMLAKMK